MHLTVITHTRGDRPELLRRCVESVEQALPEGATHKVVTCSTIKNWAISKAHEASSAELVAFVDDDDEVTPTAFSDCMLALSQDIGVACTDEAVIGMNGRIVSCLRHTVTYEGVCSSPRELHNLAVINTKFLDPNVYDMAHSEYHIGISWLLVGCAAMRGGAIHIPRIGYLWHETHNSMSKQTTPEYLDVADGIGAFIRNYGRGQRRGVIPTYPLKEHQHGRSLHPQT